MTRFRLQRIWRAQSGLTLIELLAVVVILVILSLMAVPLIGEVTDRAREARSREDIRLISDMLEAYKAENGHYPLKLSYLVTDGFLKPGNLESPWSREGHLVYYYYGVRTSDGKLLPDSYVVGDPANNACVYCVTAPDDWADAYPDSEEFPELLVVRMSW